MESLRDIAKGLARPGSQRLVYPTAAAAVVALLAYGRHCYLAWHALGEGGVPRSLRGWLINVAAQLIARRDHRAVPAPYERKTGADADLTISLPTRDEVKYGAHTRASFFSAGTPLRPRVGARPDVPTFVVPQRQTSETASDAVVRRQNAFLEAVAAANPRLFAIRPSALESPKFSALWLIPSATAREGAKGKQDVDPAGVAWLPPAARGEVAHVHHEGSTHVCLSLVDAAEVVRSGWGERHRMSGVAGILPWSYVLVYALREGENGAADWEAWRDIVVAAARVVARSAGFEGEVVVPK